MYNKENEAKVVAVLFNWKDEISESIISEQFTGIEEYVSGEF